jgi:flagellar basal body-associated protein FliL
MITKLTTEQESNIPVYIKKWVGKASGETDRTKATKAVKDMYKAMGEDEPLVIFGQSPMSTAYLSVMFFELAKSNKGLLPTKKKDSQLRSQLYSQLDSQLRSQLYSQLYSQLDSQLRSQLDSQLRSQLRSQLDSQLRSQLYSQLRSQLYSQLRSQLRSQLKDINYDWYNSTWWLVWAGWYDFGQYIGVEFDKKAYKLFMSFVENIGFIIPYKGVVFISDKPTNIVWENERLSFDHDRAVQYADGWGLYCLDGVNLEKEEWEKTVNQQWTLEEIAKAKMGADKSAVIIKYLKPDLLLEQVKAKLIHTGIKGTRLYEVKNFMDTGDTEYCMRMKHPSLDTEYIEWVEPSIGMQADADLAQATAFGIPKEDYLLAIEA